MNSNLDDSKENINTDKTINYSDDKKENDQLLVENKIPFTFIDIMKKGFSNISEIFAIGKNNFKIYPLNDKENIERLIIINSKSSIRIEEKSELKFYFQKCLVMVDSGNLVIVNREYKNIYKKKVDQMKSNEIILRKLLLDLVSDQIVAFKISKSFELDNFNNSIKDLPKNLKIPSNQKFEDYFIYVIGIQLIYNIIPEPKILDYEKYCNKIYEQLKYLIGKEEYSQSISLMNKNIKNYFENKNFVNELNSKKLIKNKCDTIVEKIVSNKIFCLINKDGSEDSKRKDYEEALKALDEEYFKNYKLKKNANEDIYAKNLARKITLFIKVKNLQKALDSFDKLKNELPMQENFIKQVGIDVENFKISLKDLNEKKKNNFKRNMIQSLANMENDEKNFDQWDIALESYDLSCNIDIGIMDYIFN